MKKKSVLFLAMLVVITVVSVTLFGCVGTSSAATVKFIIDDEVMATVEAGEGASIPTITPKEGYTLSKWYFDAEFSEEFSFKKLAEKGLQGEVSVYAKWEKSTATKGLSYTYLPSLDGYEVKPRTWLHNATSLIIAEVYDDGVNGEKPVKSIAHSAFSECLEFTSVIIPDGMINIGGYAFTMCISLPSITIPDSVTSIGDNAFSGCTALTSVTIGKGVTDIGKYAFSNTSIWNNAADNSVVYADKWAVGYKGTITDIALKSDTVGIGSSAFYNCSSLISITIPNSVTSIGSSAFSGHSSLTSITVADGNTKYHSEENCLIETATKKLILGCQTSIIPTDGSVTSIGDYAFSGCWKLTSITIPDSVISIGDYAFNDCSSLTSITIPDSVTSIGDYAFNDCSSLTSITIPDSVTSIGDYAFNDCSSLTSITIPDSVTSIGYSVFNDCSSLTSIVIPDGVTSISDSAFSYCSSLTSITIPDSVTSIGSSAFSGCSELTSITIPNSVTSIGDYTFQNCRSLTSITIPEGVTSIGNWAFSGCSVLTRIDYDGTKAQWTAITKGFDWNEATGEYTVHCTDGTISKANS